jgi:anti-sigma factor (TIGR02949 family)
MNVIHIEQNKCKKVQTYLDSYLDNELRLEMTQEVSKHLETCANCYDALLLRRQVKERLKMTILKDSAPVDLQERVRTSLRKNPSTTRMRWMLVAAAVIGLMAAVGAIRLFNQGTPTDFRVQSAAGNANARLLKIGLDDHVHCAVDSGLANRVFTEEEMLEKLGLNFSGLVTLIQEKAPENYRVVVGHRCKVKGREFVHLILKSPGTALSLVITGKNGESFSEDKVEGIIESSGVPIHEAHLNGLEIAGFETQDYLAFVVSDLGYKENLQVASILAPSVRDFFSKRGA